MNITEAKEIIKTRRGVFVNEEERTLKEYWQAKGFLEGAASRDALIKELVEKIEKVNDEIGGMIINVYPHGRITIREYLKLNECLARVGNFLRDEVIKPPENKE